MFCIMRKKNVFHVCLHLNGFIWIIFFFPPTILLCLYHFFLFILSKLIFKISHNQEFCLRHISMLSCKYSRSLEKEAKNWILNLPKKFESIYVNFYFNHLYKVFRILFVIVPHFLWKMCSANILYVYMCRVFRRQLLCMLKHMNARNKGLWQQSTMSSFVKFPVTIWPLFSVYWTHFWICPAHQDASWSETWVKHT